MEYVKLGRTGLEVSRICLGCMTYGDASRGNHSWTLDDAASRPLIQRALELGINPWTRPTFTRTAAARKS